MKKFGFFFFLALLFWQNPVFSLPGNSKGDITSWIKGHPFLSPYYFKTDTMGVELRLVAYRQLKDNHFVDVMFDFSRGVSYAETMTVVKREYTPNKEPNGNDKRPWTSTHVVDVWDRENQTAQELLSNIYGPQIADDFKRSKLVFDGGDYYEKGFTVELERYQIPANSPHPIVKWSDVKIYLGKLWAYEHFKTEEWQQNELTIMPLKDAQRTISLLSSNKKLAEAYTLRAQKMQNRTQPADITVK